MINYYHYSSNKIQQLHNNYTQRLKWKPTGFWLSKNNEWYDWCINNGCSTFNTNNYFKHKIKFKDDIRLYICDSLDSFYSLVKNYNNDWIDLSEEYDGIVFDNYNEIKKKLILNPECPFIWFFGIDVNCCVVWNTNKIYITYIKHFIKY